MGLNGSPPFRADHIGSLLRPPELLEARHAQGAGKISREDLRRAEDEAIVAAIHLQESVGLHAITDGEFRRHIYFGHFAAAVDGFEEMEAERRFRDADGEPMTYRTDVITGKLHRARGIATDEFEFVRSHTSHTVKATLPSPAGMHYFRFHDGISEKAYPDVEEFFADLVAVYREELAELGRLGATFVQLDDVALPMLCDPAQRDEQRARGRDVDALIDRYVKLTNEVLAGRPEGMTIGMHLCRGNNQGKWLGQGGYEFIAQRAFQHLDIDVYFLEYDTDRAGGFEPLRFMPDDKFVVLGLVSSKVPQLEQVDALRGRIDEASKYVPMERLGLSPQCGFASVEQGNPITVDDERRKLGLVVEVADSVW